MPLRSVSLRLSRSLSAIRSSLASFPSAPLYPSSFLASAASRKPRSHLSLPKLLVRFPLVNIGRAIKRSRLLGPDRDIDDDTGYHFWHSIPFRPPALRAAGRDFMERMIGFFFLPLPRVRVRAPPGPLRSVSIGMVAIEYLEKLQRSRVTVRETRLLVGTKVV